MKEQVVSEETYGRGQVEWALWCTFSGRRVDAAAVPQIFSTRIKRLLEIDRRRDFREADEPPEAEFAFAPPPSAKSGEIEYRAVDAFCLAIALDLLDAGFKQTEIVFLMRHLRPELEAWFPDLLARPSLTRRGRQRAKDYPHLPSYDLKGHSYADPRLFLILQKLELTEIIPDAARGRVTEPVILEPTFCPGIADLGAQLHDIMPNRRRVVMVLEIAATAQFVHGFLSEAPAIRRGRPKG